MKKFKFISAIALTLVMASCEDYELPNPPGQENPDPEAVFTGADLEIASPAVKEINLLNQNAENKDALVGEISKLDNFPTDYSLVIDMEAAANDSFGKVSTVPTTIVGDQILVNPDRFNAAIQEVLTKEPGTYDVAVRFVAYAVRNNTKLRLGGLDHTYCTETLKVRSLDPEKELDQNYYFVPCDANGAPQWAKALKMNNTSGGGVSVYDNPEFAVKFDVTEAGLNWKIAPAAAYDAKDAAALMGCKAQTETNGKLVTGQEAGAIKTMVGPILCTVNVELDSYQLSYALDVLYPLSGTTLNKPENALLLYTSNYINYTGVTTINTTWKLCGQPDQNGAVVFRQDAELGFEDSEDLLTRTGYLTAMSDGAQLVAPVKKLQLYWADVNLIQMTYSITCLETLSVIGSGNDWNLETATELTPNKDKTVWTAEKVKIGDMFKINANGAWDIDFGFASNQTGAFDKQFDIEYKAGNIEVEAGTYDVTVDFSTRPYTVTLK